MNCFCKSCYLSYFAYPVPVSAAPLRSFSEARPVGNKAILNMKKRFNPGFSFLPEKLRLTREN